MKWLNTLRKLINPQKDVIFLLWLTNENMKNLGAIYTRICYSCGCISDKYMHEKGELMFSIVCFLLTIFYFMDILVIK